MSGLTKRAGDDRAGERRWPHVACLVEDGRSFRTVVPVARRACAGGGRLTVLYADRWSNLAFAGEYVVDVELLHEGAEIWLRERLLGLGLADAEGVVVDSPQAPVLRAWLQSAHPDLVVAVEPGGRISRLARWSLSGDLVRHAGCPVLLVGREIGGGRRRKPVPGPTTASRARWMWVAP